MSTMDQTFLNGLKNYSSSRNFTYREIETGTLLTAAEYGHLFVGVSSCLYHDCMLAGLNALENHPGYELHITKRDITNLKNEWLSDPNWDIEDTEGFESFRVELKSFSDEQIARWEQEFEQKQQERMEDEKALRRRQNEEARNIGVEGLHQMLLKQQEQIRDVQNILTALTKCDEPTTALKIMEFAIAGRRWPNESDGVL